MMLGVLPGGECQGLAFRYELAREAEVLEYLDKREGEGRANRRVMLPIQLLPENGHCLVNAWSYLPFVSYEHYVGALDEEKTAHFICQGKGRTGSSLEYFQNLMSILEELQVREQPMEKIRALIGARNGRS